MPTKTSPRNIRRLRSSKRYNYYRYAWNIAKGGEMAATLRRLKMKQKEFIIATEIIRQLYPLYLENMTQNGVQGSVMRYAPEYGPYNDV